MAYAQTVGCHHYVFDDLRTLLARASPDRSGDRLAGLAAGTEEERVAARMALSNVPLRRFLDEPVVASETDEVTALILDSHDAAAFAPVASTDRRRVPRLAPLGCGNRRRLSRNSRWV